MTLPNNIAGATLADINKALRNIDDLVPGQLTDVLVYNSISDFPPVGREGKYYQDKSTRKTYKWNGSTYVETQELPSLGGAVIEYDSNTHRYFTKVGNTRVDLATYKDAVTIVPLTDATETMASISQRLYQINMVEHLHVFFDTAGVPGSPLYLCTIYIDSDATMVRVSDQVTGKTYVGPYNATETLASVLGKAVDPQVPIIVEALTQDGVTVTGQTVYVHEGSDATGPVYDSLAYNGQPVTFVVPRGFQYFVRISSELPDHFSPSTATGVARVPVSVTLTYQDVSNIVKPSGIRGFLDGVEADTSLETEAAKIAFAKAAILGKEIADTFTTTGGTTYSNPIIVTDVRYWEKSDGTRFLGAEMQRKWCTSFDVVYDAPEGVACDPETETVAEEGVYYYGLPSGQTKTAANLVRQWATPYATGSSISVNALRSYNGTIYKCITAYTPTASSPTPDSDTTHWEATTAKHLSAGDALPYSTYGTIYKSSINESSKNIFQYGYNNWAMSGVRQFLNSAEGVGAWWQSTHVGDVAPSTLASQRGYMAGCSQDLLSAITPVKIKTWPNSVTDGPNDTSTVYETVDTFFLPSGIEVAGDVNMDSATPIEGGISDYWLAQINSTGITNAAKNPRKMIAENANSGNPAGVNKETTNGSTTWLRSANRGNSYLVWSVYASGSVNYGIFALNAFRLVPACVI